MKTVHVLICGGAGSGKTYLAKYFKRRGVNAYNADSMKGVARWVNKDGKVTKYNRKTATSKWWAENWWEWDKKVIKRMLKRNKEVFLFGNANNNFDITNLFDRIYYLKANKKLIAKRLQSKSRPNAFGKSAHERKMILSWITWDTKKAKEHGFIIVDASLPARKIFEIIYNSK